jgi:hypothetical protein
LPVYRYPPTEPGLSILVVDNWVGCGQLDFGGPVLSVAAGRMVTGGRRPRLGLS